MTDNNDSNTGKISNTVKISKNVVKRRENRKLGVFIDGVGLDRAARRLNRRVDLAQLLRGVSSGTTPIVARYYTIIPNTDDARQHAYLDAVSKAGLEVVVKRLPPIGVNRQTLIEIEMAADMVAFAQGHDRFSGLSTLKEINNDSEEPADLSTDGEADESGRGPIKRIVTVVCPSRDLAYPMALIKEFGIDTVTADFGQFSGQDVLKSAAKWIDLSNSETIWKES